MNRARGSLGGMVNAGVRRLRRTALVGVCAFAAAILPVTLVAAWLVSPLPAWRAPSPAPLLLELAALLTAVAAVVYVSRRWLGELTEGRVATTAETGLGLPAGALQGLLELGRGVPTGTSEALFRREETEAERRFLGMGHARLTGELGRLTGRRRSVTLLGMAGWAALAATLGFISPKRSTVAWTPLLHPVAQLSPPLLPPLTVAPGDAEISRGGSLDVSVTAPGRATLVLEWRIQGDVPRRAGLTVRGEKAAGQVPRVDAPARYWVTAPDGAVSDTFRITPVDPLLVSGLEIQLVYPSYLERPSERYEGEIPPLEIPEGTLLVIHGRATRPLGAARLAGPTPGAGVALQVAGAQFNTRWRPVGGGLYEWDLRGADGSQLAARPTPLDLTLVPDLAPQVEISFPGVDTLFNPDLRQAIAADARDDHGLAAAALISWRVSALGDVNRRIEQAIPLEGAGDRMLLRAILDANGRRLLPGDTLKYLVRVTDNSPRHQTADSRTYALRLPSMEELRDRAGQEAATNVAEAQEVARAAQQLADATRGLQRRTEAENARRAAGEGGNASGGGGGKNSLTYEQSEQARQVLDEQRRLLDKVDTLRNRMQAMERALEQAGLRDPELQARLQELRDLYDQILTPELRQKLADLQKALERLDPEQVQKALEQLAGVQEQFKKQLDRSLELMRRAAAEQQMNALAQEAREISTQQKALAESMSQQTPTDQQIQVQRGLGRRSQQLGQKLAGLQQKLRAQGEDKTADQSRQAADQVQSAEQQMQQAAEQAGRRQGEQAARSGEQAAEQLDQAAQRLASARQEMAQGWKKEVQQTVQQATTDALSLAQRQNQLLQSMQQAAGRQPGAQQQAGRTGRGQQQGQRGQQGQRSGQVGGQGGGRSGGLSGAPTDLAGMRAAQAALKQGLEQLGRNLAEAGERTALLNRTVGAALGRANLSMDQTMKGLENAQNGQRLPTQEAAQTVESLNRLALALLNNNQQIQESETGTGLQQALQQLAELARQQGALNGQSNALLPLNLAPRLMSQQLGQLARQQQQIAQQLQGLDEQTGNQKSVLGRLDEMAKEADRLAQDLAGGRLSADVVARQERLFHRLLDAGRSMEKDEYSQKRVGERPGDVAPSLARPLDPSLLKDAIRFPAPTPEQLRGLPPAMRRWILDYFERLNRAGSTGSGRSHR